ncbi:PAS-domain containing protein, partial [Rhizobiaceae bacterium]|nr:PAS-domain containing protein [Rhizobiaceae bacterium]
LAQALENMADGFALFDRDGFLVAINERYRELSPYLAPVLQIGVAHDDVIRAVYRSGEVEIEGYTEDEFVAFANRQRLSSTQASFHRTREGRWMRYAPRRLDDGSTLFLQSDVTEMKAHEERAEATDRQLVRRTNEFETAMSSMPDGFILFDAKGNMIACNQRYREMLGLPDEILVPGVSRARLMDVAKETGLFAQAHVQEVSDAYEVSRRRSDPHTFLYTMADGRVLQMRFTPIQSGGSAVLVIDQTAELQAEEKLQRYSRQLERSNSELQNFAYVASHDLQEPLRKIEAFGDRLSKKHGDSLPEGGQHYLDRILDASGRMRQLINDLLSFSRVSAKTHKPGLTDLASVLSDVTNDMEMRLEETGATIEADDLPSIEADPTLMRQLFQNLIANSIKFARKDVAPVIRIETERHSGIQSGGLLMDEVQLRFSDNGIGFDNRFKDQIFTIFQRLHGRSEYEGTGIGLATCRRIVDRHHGTIEASGVPGEGATFTVQLPAEQPEVESLA